MPVQNLGVISVNVWSILISLCNLLIIYVILKKILFKPIHNIISQRNEEINKTYAEADKALSEATQSKLAYNEKLNYAHVEAEEIIRNANEKAGKIQKELIYEANLKADAVIKNAEEQIALDKKKAENEIRTHITDVSLIIAEKLVDREINASDHEKMINEFIDDVKR